MKTDLEAVVHVLDDEVMQWQGFPDLPGVKERLAKHWIMKRSKPFDESLAICESSSGQIIGVAHMAAKKHRDVMEFGLSIGGDWRNKGYGSETIAALTKLAPHMGFSEIQGETEISNARARAIFEKAGFKLVGEGNHTLPNKRTVRAVRMNQHIIVDSSPCPLAHSFLARLNLL